MRRQTHEIQFIVKNKYMNITKGSVVNNDFGEWEVKKINNFILLGEEVFEKEGTVLVYATAYKVEEDE